MQEKVSHAPPPPIRMIENKPPPTSWVTENIVRFYQVQSQVEILKNVMTYLQARQSMQLEEAHGKALPLKESYVPLPEKGSPTDISTRAAFNSFQGYIKTQIHYFESLIHILMQGDPKLAAELKSMLDQLQRMGQSFPQLNQQQLQSLSQMMETLLRYAKDAPNTTQRFFWNEQLNMLHSLMSQNGANIKDFQREINELNSRSKMLIAVEELLQNMQDILKKQPPSKEEFMELLSHMQNLANQNAWMDPAQSQALLSFFEQLGNFKNTKGTKLSEIAADALIQTKLSEFIKKHPQATPEEIKNHLEKFLNESNLKSSQFDFMRRVGSAFEEILEKKGFPLTQSHSGHELVSKKADKIEENPAFITELLAGFAPEQNSVSNLARSAQGVSSKISEEIHEISSQREGLQNAIVKLSSAQNIFGKTALWAIGQSLQTGHAQPKVTATAEKSRVAAAAPKGAAAPASGGAASNGEPNLPWEFQNAILNHYMPGQENYLEALAFTLSLLNDGADFGNILLNKFMGWDGAGTTFIFNEGLHPTGTTPNTFSGNSTDAANQLKEELEKTEEYMKDIEDELKPIQDKLDEYNKQLNDPNSKLTPAQQQILHDKIKQLGDIKGNLEAAHGQLKELDGTLKSIAVTPVDPKDPTKGFTITNPQGGPAPPDWQKNLADQEDHVINGDPSVKGGTGYQGGLVHCNGLMQNFQQTFAEQSQTQQMMLQMHMTEIQQEWTVVSTSLQLLFQMYSSLAQAIYK